MPHPMNPLFGLCCLLFKNEPLVGFFVYTFFPGEFGMKAGNVLVEFGMVRQRRWKNPNSSVGVSYASMLQGLQPDY